MTEDNTVFSIDKDSLAKYFPERNYISRGYEPFYQGFEDLCGHCHKYYEFIHDRGLKKTAEVPQCAGHITTQFGDLDEADFTEEEYTDFLVAADPITWAYHMFGWKARWYQEEVCSCTALRKVVRAGRRCGKTMCVSVLALWKLATLPDQTILIIAPFEVQVQKIFDEIHKFISQNSALSAAVKRSTKNPSRLEFNNGSKALGFSSGNNNAAGSDKIRGQDANYIIIDEADYINQVDMEAIMAILASHPDCGIWASSTPTGFHEKFYQLCMSKDLGFKEFWFISAESPNWTEEVDQFYKQSYSASAYQHEFLAEFGIQESGVFRNDLVDRALSQYDMPRDRTPGSRIVIGADWNGQSIGTHIVVVEVVGNRQSGVKYIPLEKRVIKGGDFTQHEAVEAIVELNQIYQPDYIYVDAGYGEVQVEMLHRYGKSNPKTKLHKKVKPYAMQKNIEIIDPVTGIKIKKNAKPFMVNIAVMQLEEDRVVLPLSEDTAIVAETVENDEANTEQGLVQQMRNFSIERVSSNGLPTYSQGNDHTLTAWMLALTGFVLEFSDLRKKNHYIPAQLVGHPGESKEESEHHGYVRLAENIRQLDRGVQLPKYNNMGSIPKAIRQGEALKKAFEAGRKQEISNYFKINRGTRKADLGTKRNRDDTGRRRLGGRRRMF
jgi:replicative DNA helicase